MKNPLTGEVYNNVDYIKDEDLDNKISMLNKGFKNFKSVNYGLRSQLLLNLATLLEQRR